MNKVACLGLLSVSSLLTAAGCAATPHEDTATGGADIVGVTDLTTLEQSLDLKRTTPGNPGDAAALQSGACYSALIENPTWTATFEFRRYTNGAAFWAKLGSGYNSGDQRPVLCVDLHRPDGGVSLSGAALDAVLRYDLGRYVGSDSGMQKTHLAFERGGILLSHYDVTDQERFASVQKRPHEQPFENASTISGRILSLTIKDVRVEPMFDQPTVRDMEMSGQVAHFIYRYAWRKNEETGRFTLGEDAIGAFVKRATTFGDGPGYGETWSFTRGSLAYSHVGNFEGRGEPTTDETMSLTLPGASPTAAPLAECTRTTADHQPPPSFGCTGL